MLQKKPTIEPANIEQKEAVIKGIDFIENGDSSQFFVIVGKAGTGKTTISQLIGKHFKHKKILVCALSHKAKLVIAEKMGKAIGKKNVVAKSVAGALAMKMDNETGKFKLNDDRGEIPIREADIVIVDEGSMINEECHGHIMNVKRKRTKVIYLGDVRQLPPIREHDSPFKGKPSPVFYGKNIAILKERIRQGENSPILPFSDFFGDNSRIAQPVLNPVPPAARRNVVTSDGAIVFADNMKNIIEKIMPLYKYAVENNLTDVIKTVSYRNNARKAVNDAVRLALFGEDSYDNQIMTGDLLMFQDNYMVQGFEEPLSNALEVQALSAYESVHENYKIWQVEFVFEKKPISVMVLDQSELKKHSNDVQRLFEIAKKLPWGSWERSTALSEAWELKDRYAPLEHAYAITSHKAQGSTYNCVIVNETDIMSVTKISNQEKSQSMYVAVSRAETTCIILDGQTPGHSLQYSISLVQTKLIM